MGRVDPIDIMKDPNWIAFNGPGVYIFQHEDRGYLYIGLAKSVFKRLWDYRALQRPAGAPKLSRKSRWSLLCIPPPDKVTVSVHFCDSYSEARKLETKLIHQHMPYYNYVNRCQCSKCINRRNKIQVKVKGVR